MPYQPTNPYPYNTGVDLREGLTLQFRVDNYDTIVKFEIEIYDLLKNEKVYTIIREIGDIETINEDKDVTVGDMVADENSFNYTAIEDEGLSAELMKSLNSLEEREKEVLMLRFGFYGGNGMTLEEIGNKINLSKERVRQIEKKALEKMRHPIRCKKLKEFL